MACNSMSDLDKRTIRESFPFLLDNLEVNDALLGFLFKQCIISEDHYVDIANLGTTQKGKVQLLVFTLLRRGPDAFEGFLEALERSEQKYIAKELRDCKIRISEKGRIQPDHVRAKGKEVENLCWIGGNKFASVTPYEDTILVHVREHEEWKGQRYPTKKGIALPPDQWQKFKDLIPQIDSDIGKIRTNQCLGLKTMDKK